MTTDRVTSTRSILAVDDEPDHTRLLAALLHEFDVHEAHTARSALRIAKRRPFHAYILDYRLPDIDGAGLCRRIREFDPHTPILVFSAESAAKQALEAGANLFIPKGGDPLQMMKSVAALIARQTARNHTARDAEVLAIAEEIETRAAQEPTSTADLKIAMQEVAATVAATREMLEAIRAVRSVAFQCYARSGGARAGFIEDWPQTCAATRRSGTPQWKSN